jgi:hypothetical protein
MKPSLNAGAPSATRAQPAAADHPFDERHRHPFLGPLAARYLAFPETITQIRPRLHRYCSRMTGSVMDGEDVVQDALF